MMSRRKKTLEPELQTTMESQNRIVISVDCRKQSKLLEKEEAGKPLYLKRV